METSSRQGGTWRPGALPGPPESWLCRVDSAAQGDPSFALTPHAVMAKPKPSPHSPNLLRLLSYSCLPRTFFSQGFAEMSCEVLPPSWLFSPQHDLGAVPTWPARQLGCSLWPPLPLLAALLAVESRKRLGENFPSAPPEKVTPLCTPFPPSCYRWALRASLCASTLPGHLLPVLLYLG